MYGPATPSGAVIPLDRLMPFESAMPLENWRPLDRLRPFESAMPLESTKPFERFSPLDRKMPLLVMMSCWLGITSGPCESTTPVPSHPASTNTPSAAILCQGRPMNPQTILTSLHIPPEQPACRILAPFFVRTIT